MKGMQKISRGASFGGVMAYAFEGDQDNPRELEGEVVGGNMSGHDPKSLAREFNASKAVRPDIKKPVWHNSLRLTKDEKLSPEQWAEIGDAYMSKMGFSENHQRVYVLHDDKDGQHIHIVASRIGLDGKLFLGKNENFASTKIINGLEKEFSLVPTKGADYDANGKVVMPSASRARKDEIEKAVRSNVEPVRYQLQTMIDRAMMDKPSVTTFVERLQIAGVDVVPNIASTGKLNGFSFGLDGLYYSGSKLGDKYKQSSLEKRGLTYDKDRESAFLEELRESSRNHANLDGRAEHAEKPGRSADRASDPAAARDAEHLRGVDRRADRAGAGTLAADDSTSPRRGERDDGIDRESRHAATEVDESHGSRRDSAEVDPGTKTGVERPGAGHGSMAPDRSGSAAAGDPGAGIGTGVDVTGAGLITTGDKGTDELLQAAHSGRLKAEREVLSRQKKQHHEDMANAKKRQAELDKPHTNRLSLLAGRGMDSTWREIEIQRFAQVLGAAKFQVTCTPANAKAEATKKTYSAEDLRDPKVLKDLAHQAARNHQITIQPHDSAGLVMLKGLDAKDIIKLEAAGLAPAAVVSFAGKHQVWIATGSTMSADERKALTKRIEAMVGVDKAAGMAGRLVCFAGAGLTAGTGQVAPAAAELLGEIKSEIFEAKATARLAKAIEKEVVIRDRDFDDVGGIKSLRKGFLNRACHAAEAEATFFGGKYDAVQVERGVLEAMARQGVKPSQAYRAVFDDSRVAAGDERHAADSVAQAYTRVALVKEGKTLAGVDVAAESVKRYPQLMKRAETRTDSELKALHEKGKADGMAESARMAKEAEQRQIDRANEAIERKAREMDDGLLKPK